MDKTNVFNIFFSYLSYLGNENALSDVIAATCNTSFTFKKLFLDFFFPGKNLVEKCPSAIEREVWSEDKSLRFDLYFTTTDNEEFIIENKIYDRNDHFDEYTKVYKEDHIGYIANYNVDEKKYTHKHTWEEFLVYLKKHAIEKEEKLLIDGVVQYIQEVCGIMEEKNFKLKELNDLGYFLKCLKNLLIKMGFEINNKAKGSSEERVGFWCYKNKSFWFGVYLNDDGKYGFSIWGGIYDYEIKNNKFDNLSFSKFDPKDNTDKCKWFKLNTKFITKLSDEAESYDDKICILEKFISEIEGIK